MTETLKLYPEIEQLDADRSFDQLLAAPLLRPMPLIVLSADHPWGPLVPGFIADGTLPPDIPPDFGYVTDRAAREAQAKLAASVPGARHVTNTDSGHEIHKDQPQLVIDSNPRSRQRRACRPERDGALMRAIAPLFLLVLMVLPPRPASGQVTPAGAPAVCRIGVNVEDLYDLDMARDTFGAILWIWSVCPSADLAPLGTIAFPTASTGLNLSPIEVETLASGGQYASRRVQGTFRYNWEMDHYPFDRQGLVIPIDETLYGAGRLTFEADQRESFVTPIFASGSMNGEFPTWRSRPLSARSPPPTDCRMRMGRNTRDSKLP